MSKKRLNKRTPKFVQQLSNKKDNSEKAKGVKTLAIIIIVFILFIFSITLYVVNSQNSIREIVANNPKTVSAVVIDISRGNNAEYEFSVNGMNYSGSTFKDYNGHEGDIICVEY